MTFSVVGLTFWTRTTLNIVCRTWYFGLWVGLDFNVNRVSRVMTQSATGRMGMRS